MCCKAHARPRSTSSPPFSPTLAPQPCESRHRPAPRCGRLPSHGFCVAAAGPHLRPPSGHGRPFRTPVHLMDGANILAMVGVRQPCGSVPPKIRVFGKRIEGVAAGCRGKNLPRRGRKCPQRGRKCPRRPVPTARRPAENRCYVKKFTYDVSFFTYDVIFFT